MPISDLSAETLRVSHAGSLPALLAAAYRAFDRTLQEIRRVEDHAGLLLPAFVLAAAAAADGRDAVAAARSFPGPPSGPTSGLTSLTAIDLADQLAELSLVLATRLHDAATVGGQPSCSEAAAHAGRMHELLASPG